MNQLESSIERILEAIAQRIPSIVLGLILLILGGYLIRLILSIVRKRFERNEVDLSLRDFIMSLLRFVLYAMLLLSCASTMGIQTTSFLAVLSAASLAIGLSLQGSLSNFAGGILILLFKPFRVGDSITSTTGATGTVERIDILYTTLRTAEGIAVFAPNGTLANSIVTNYSNLHQRRITYRFVVAGDTDIKKARSLILDVFRNDPRILESPAPEVLVEELTSNGVRLIIHAWASKNDYSHAYFENQERIKETLNTHRIIMPPSAQGEAAV